MAAGLLMAAGMGVAGRVPVGSDHSAYAGVDRLAALVRSQPAGTIVYHRSLGWYFDYYLFGSGEEPLWSNDAATLAADAARTAGRQPARGQWLALASADDAGLAAQAQSALAAEGLSLDERQQVYRPDGSVAFTLYQIVVPPQEQAAALPGAALPGDPLPGGGLHAGAR